MRHPYGIEIQHLAYLGTDTTDAHGNQIESWASAVPIPGCAVWQTASTENVDGRDAVLTITNLATPPGVALGPKDRVLYGGHTWSVTGYSFDWTNPFTGDNPGAVAVIERVEG